MTAATILIPGSGQTIREATQWPSLLHRVLDDIRAGRLAAGTRTSRADLARRYGSTPDVARKAVAVLADAGVVDLPGANTVTITGQTATVAVVPRQLGSPRRQFIRPTRRIPEARHIRTAGDLTWQPDGACIGDDPELYFSDDPTDIAATKATCATCPVIADCLRWALSHDIEDGVWGGLTTGERDALRKTPAA